MTALESKPYRVRIRGPVACFTRPELKAERVSYEVMTPSAARGALEAVFWKPAIRWRIHEIAVLAPIAWISFRRNEVNDHAMRGKTNYMADEDRAQRNTVALRDVDYAVKASFALVPDKVGPEDNLRKFEEMFERRLEKGQCFHRPYLGCREFVADVLPAPESLQPVDSQVDRPLGLMLYDFDYRTLDAIRPLFFQARLQHGIVQVPSWEEVLAENGSTP